MDHRASRSGPVCRTRRTVLVGLAVVTGGMATYVVRPSLVGSAPSSSSTGVGQPAGTRSVVDEGDGAVPRGVAVAAPAPPRSRVDVGGPPDESHARGEADGVIPDGSTVSVFDDELPAVRNLDPDLREALRRAATDAEADGVELRVNSGWRSPAHQQRLLEDAVLEHGSHEEALRWVATAETSAHVSGDAVDVGPSYAARWLSEHGAAHGMCQIYGNEPWHFELRPAAVEHGCPPLYADPTEDPRMQP